MVYRYHIFEDIEDLQQHAMHECFKNFLKFNPSKGTCFNYFSIIAKISLLNYTDRRKRHRNHSDIEEQVELIGRPEPDYEIFLDSVEDTLFEIIDENFVGNRRKKYVKIASVIIHYLRITKKFISKSDLYAFARSYSIKNTEIREFVKSMSKYNSELFGLIDDEY